MSETKDTAKIKEAVKRRKRETYTPVKPDLQLGFVHNNVDCIGCRACEIACKDKNGLPPGPRFRRVQYVEGGEFPNVYAYKVNMSCNHCAQPACLPTCPTGAIFKRKDNGVVDIDDIINVVLDFGTDCSAHNGDVDCSGLVDSDDVVEVVINTGPSPC